MQNMKIMKSSWIYDVWTEGVEENVLADSSQFDKHKLPVFYKLRVTTTGLGKKEKKEIEDLVNNGGGQYFGEFSSANIDIVIAKRNATETPKLKAAMSQHKECLCVEWIQDSCKKGWALPLESYRIDLQMKKITSTPERSPSSNTLCPVDVSNINVSTVNDTAMSNLSIASELGMNRKRKSNEAANENKDLSYKAAYEKLNFQEAKRAGQFLDSCSVSSIVMLLHLELALFLSFSHSTHLFVNRIGFYLWFHNRGKGENKENSQCWQCNDI